MQEFKSKLYVLMFTSSIEVGTTWVCGYIVLICEATIIALSKTFNKEVKD